MKDLREAASAAGSVHFDAGKPCKHGHVSLRFVSSGNCIECVKVRQSAYSRTVLTARVKKWRAANREQRNTNAREWYLKNAEKSCASTRKWQRNNAERVATSKLKWNLENQDRIRESGTKWRVSNPEKVRATKNRRYARKLNAEGSFTAEEFREILKSQDYRCAAPHCRKDISKRYSVDHILPLSRGGSNWPDNIQGLCPSCNSSKRDRTMEEWLSTMYRRIAAEITCSAEYWI